MPEYFQHAPGSAGNTYGSLPKRTLDYLATGAPQGMRNEELFEAALQYRDAGYSIGHAEARLVGRAILDGLSETEAKKTIKSGYNAPSRAPVGQSGGIAPAAPWAKVKPPPAPPPSPVSAPGGNGAQIPNPLADGFKVLIETAFRPQE